MDFEQLTDYKIASDLAVPHVVPAFRVLDVPRDVSFISIVVHNVLSPYKSCGYLKSYWRASEMVTGQAIGIDQRRKTRAVQSAIDRTRTQMLDDNNKWRDLIIYLEELYTTHEYAINPQYIDECQRRINNYVKEYFNAK